MNKLTWFGLIILSILPCSQTLEVHSIANLVELVIRENEPSFKLIQRDGSGRQAEPSEDDHVSLYFKLNGQEVFVGTTNQKTSETAKFSYGASTITQIMRPTYRLSPDGEKLRRMVDEAGFLMNSTSGRIESGRHSTFDVAFRKGNVVIVVEARKRELAQRIALYLAESLPAA